MSKIPENEFAASTVRSKKPTEGSALYYALSSTTKQKREKVVTILALCHTLSNMLADVSEPTVAEQKIHWWHEELERMQLGAARHPNCIAVAEKAPQVCTDLSHWLAVLSANSDEKFVNAADDSAFLQRLQKDYSARLQLCCSVLQENSSTAPAPQWSLGFGQFERLKRFHFLHTAGYPVLPDSTFKEHKLEPHELRLPEKRGEAKMIFTQQINAARDNLTQVLNNDDSALQRGSLPIYILAVIRVAQLSSWQRHSLLPTEAYSTLTPLKKAWLAWRCRAQFRAKAE